MKPRPVPGWLLEAVLFGAGLGCAPNGHTPAAAVFLTGSALIAWGRMIVKAHRDGTL